MSGAAGGVTCWVLSAGGMGGTKGDGSDEVVDTDVSFSSMMGV